MTALHGRTVFLFCELLRVDGEGRGKRLGHEDQVGAGLHLLQQTAETLDVGVFVLPSEVGLDIGEMEIRHNSCIVNAKIEN